MEKPAGAKSKKQASKGPAVQKITAPDPFSPQNIKQLGLRLGLPLLAVWVIGGCVAGVTQSKTAFWIALGIPAVITVGIAGLVVWVVGQARKAKSVAGLLQNVETAEDRKVALEKLDAGFKKNDPAAVFARAQLMLQEGDTKKALETLEQIDLARVMAPVADEARAQRAMIHLLIGEVTPARDLVDAIDLSRQQDPKARAMMGSVVAEAWARTGQAKKAADTIALFNPEDPDFEQVAPQIQRARAFVYAATGDVKAMRRALKKLLEQDARLLGSFLGKRTHPLLQKEAKQMLQASGQVPRKMQIQRH
jgi:tetratricopeptide (TPR) repeat protein